MKTILTLLIAVLLITATCRQTSKPTQQNLFDFDLTKIATSHFGTCKIQESDVFKQDVLLYSPQSEEDFLVLTDSIDVEQWKNAKYLVCEVWHTNDYSAILYFDFFKKAASGDEEKIVEQGGAVASSEPRIAPKIGVLPYLKTKVIFPLSHLDAQHIFMDRFPRQLKGTVMGKRLDIEDIAKVQLRVMPFQAPDYRTSIQIAAIYLTDSLPEPYEKPEMPVVDEFGQWAAKYWKGKIKSLTGLKTAMAEVEKLSTQATYPTDWGQYGGWKEKQFAATGFFRTQNDGKRWWMVDPEGYAFISIGVDCIRDNITGVISGQEDLYAKLPDKNDSLFEKAYSDRQDMESVDFLKVNMMTVYGENWRKKWEEITVGFLKQYRINTIANWSDLEFAKIAKVPYLLPMSGYPTTELKLYRDFPDVFDPVYAQRAIEFAAQLNEYKDDPYLIGYFLDNEPHWAFGNNNLAFEMFATPDQSFTKKEFVKWISAKYKNDIAKFNQTWSLKLADFNALATQVFKDLPSKQAETDFNDFSGVMVDKYVSVVCSEVKKVDKNHLNLGLRYAWISSDLCYRAGNYFDVFSINGYSFPAPPETAEIAKRSGKPVMIGEFHFGATDRGLPATGIQGAENQAARADAYRHYVEQGFARPEIIGLHYFQWYDQAIAGRFDGENYNIGFFDICNQPYKELTQGATLTHERLYRVASGIEKPFNKVIKKTPQIFY